jgi:hypothetical protein
MTTLAPLPCFDWALVKWGAPNARRTTRCSYCGAQFPDGEDDAEFVPLILWNPEGWCAEFCDACQRRWWGLTF